MATLLQSQRAPATQRRVSALRTVMVHVRGGEADRQRLRTAVSLARQYDATLYGVGCEAVPPLGASDPTGMLEGEWYIQMRQIADTHLVSAREAFDAETAGVRTEWIDVQGTPAETIARLSRAADLIVAGGRPLKRGDGYHGADAAEIMLQSGRPVLVAPPTGGSLIGKAAIVAWKDTREARRAVADALPLLARADTVEVLAVCPAAEMEALRFATAEVAEALKRHDIPARARLVEGHGDSATTELNIAADQIDADLIVAGGYGHARIGEWVFGGVTRDLLHRPERFVLLSH